MPGVAVTSASAADEEPDPVALRDGELQRIAADVTARTGALFVVITDDHGIRLAHPLPSRLGEEVSTPYAEVLAGKAQAGDMVVCLGAGDITKWAAGLAPAIGELVAA